MFLLTLVYKIGIMGLRDMPQRFKNKKFIILFSIILFLITGMFLLSNYSSNKKDVYAGSDCVSGGGVTCTATTVGADIVNTYTGAGSVSWTPPAGVTSVQYLVVAGGGGGGGYCGGGGGGGGVLASSGYSVSSSPYTITVGSGGAVGTNGSNSSFAVTAIGGGHGATGGGGTTYVSTVGGSGGGGGSSPGGQTASAAGTSGQGYAGAASAGLGGGYTSGGGGGAGAAAIATASTVASNGGTGLASSISGSSVLYGGGGGGGCGDNSGLGACGSGGSGGGGEGSILYGSNGYYKAGGSNGSANTGGGGGGGYNSSSSGGFSGGSGIVIIRYSIPAVNGACGSSNGANLSSIPSGNLCSVGTASAVSGTGPWAWTCAGANGGSTSNCLANVALGIASSRSGFYTIEKYIGVGSTTWTPPTGVISVEYLVVAGGGGGGSDLGGGGGGGGVLVSSGYSVSSSPYAVIVGAGGLGGQQVRMSTSLGNNGSNSVFGSLTAIGGGGGGSYWGSNSTYDVGKNGGSGGGNGAKDSVLGTTVSTGTSGQGNNGGTAGYNPGYPGGGGGGAGGVGGNSGATTTGGAGGVGLSSSISGTATYYAGGGGGSNYNPTQSNTSGGAGGLGGGGNGGYNFNSGGTSVGSNGVANTGGGGGGGSWSGSTPSIGGTGGSGIVIIKYLTQYLAGYNYRQPITVSNTSGAVLTNYQVKLTVNYVSSKMKADFSDLRFTRLDGVTLLPYYIESYTASTSAVVWVKVDSIPTSGSQIFMYYGNASAVTASSGDNTFDFFDDFTGTTINTTKWVKTDSGGYISQNGVLTISDGAASWGVVEMHTNANFNRADGLIVQGKYKATMVRGATYQDTTMLWTKDSGTGTSYLDYIYAFYLHSGGSPSFNMYEDGISRGTLAGTFTANTQYNIRQIIKRDGGALTQVSADGGNAWTNNYDSTYSTETPFKVGFTHYQGGDIIIDDVIVRKYASTEPTSSFGTEEISGTCGSSNGQSFIFAPTTSLCNPGTASAVSGTGPWTWTCSGTTGSPASCSANNSAYVSTVSTSTNLSCFVTNGLCSGVTIFNMYDYLGNHAELSTQSNYPYKVCCSGTNISNSCSGTFHDTVLKLSGATNAHAEKKTQSNYTGNDVCLSSSSLGVVCDYGTSCSSDFTCLASISSDTDAHVGECSTYTNKVCCRVGTIVDPCVAKVVSNKFVSAKDTDIQLCSGADITNASDPCYNVCWKGTGTPVVTSTNWKCGVCHNATNVPVSCSTLGSTTFSWVMPTGYVSPTNYTLISGTLTSANPIVRFTAQDSNRQMTLNISTYGVSCSSQSVKQALPTWREISPFK
jgi:hypothetical protein